MSTKDQLRADLARVTAERDANLKTAIAMSETCSRQDETTAALRARVAELEAEIKYLKEHCGATDEREFACKIALRQAEQRNAELVAALRGTIKRIRKIEGDFMRTSSDGRINSAQLDQAEQLLARVESAAPAKHPDETCAQCGKVKRLVGLPRCECDECNQEAAR